MRFPAVSDVEGEDHGRKCNTDSAVISAVQCFLQQLPKRGFSTCFEKCVELSIFYEFTLSFYGLLFVY